jgi:hypothetical protein
MLVLFRRRDLTIVVVRPRLVRQFEQQRGAHQESS